MPVSPTAQDYTPLPIIFGGEMLNLRRDGELVTGNGLLRAFNVDRGVEGELVGRPGLRSFATVTERDPVHSMLRLDDPLTGLFTRVWGIGESLYYGRLGNLTLAESGFSGAPLVMVKHRPNLAAQSYGYIADGRKMRKIDRLGTSSQIGLPAPTAALATEIASDLRVEIDTFSLASEWTSNSVGLSSASAANDATNKKEGTQSVQYTAGVGTATEAFTCFWNKAIAVDMTKFFSMAGTERAATDEDQVHLWMRVDKPDFVQEIRLYFVLDETFATDAIPGTDQTKNTQAYFTVFRPNLATQLIELEAFGIQAASDAIINRILGNQLVRDVRTQPTVVGEITAEQRDEGRLGSEVLATGQAQWTEYGRVGLPLRRGSFLRIGSNTERTWAHVTGVVLVVRTNTDETVKVNFDDLYFRGGYGVDASDVGRVPFDYRYINLHIKTGAKSNPSPIQAEENWRDPVRQAVRLLPVAFGDSDVRQLFYRRGGSLPDQWRLVGMNSSDGACGLDVKTDSQITLAVALQLDNDQPVTTQDPEGNAILAQPIKAIFGPIQGHFFGCGDPNRAGYLYWSKFQEPDSWPSANNEDVCPPSEELMNGAAYGTQGIVFSRERGYAIIVQLSQRSGVKVVPTQISRGLVNRYGITVGPEGIYFIARDGIFRTTGGPEQDISSAKLRPLFLPAEGVTTVESLPVIDFTQVDDLRIERCADELYFSYVGVDGARVVLVYSIPFDHWRAWDYHEGVSPKAVFCEDHRPTYLRLIGGEAGVAYEVVGNTDDGLAVPSRVRTARLNMGLPRHEKLIGDVSLELDRDGQEVRVQAFTEDASVAHPIQRITTGEGRQSYVVDIVPADTEARDVAIEVSWDAAGGHPRLYYGVLGYIVRPETVDQRATDWDFVGQYVDKRLKGVVLECDTGGQKKEVLIEADGETVEKIEVNAPGRRVLQFSFPQVEGRLLRVRPLDGDTWKLYRVQWISDEEPLQLSRWETQWTDHGVPGEGSVQFLHMKLRATARVTYELKVRQQNGAERVYGPYDVAGITGTDKQEVKVYATPEAHRGALFQHLVRSSQPFWLYREETFVRVQPWGGDAFFAHPFGNDNLDLVRGIRTAAGVAQREGRPPVEDIR